MSTVFNKDGDCEPWPFQSSKGDEPGVIIVLRRNVLAVSKLFFRVESDDLGRTGFTGDFPALDSRP